VVTVLPGLSCARVSCHPHTPRPNVSNAWPNRFDKTILKKCNGRFRMSVPNDGNFAAALSSFRGDRS
jgi:hypothetical protein